MTHLEKFNTDIQDIIEPAALGCDSLSRTVFMPNFSAGSDAAGDGKNCLSGRTIDVGGGAHQTETVITTVSELELLRTTLALDQTLFTVQRHTSRPKGSIRVECFASKGASSPGLTKITRLVAGVLKYRRNPRGLTVTNREDISHLIVTLSKKLELDLKHERLN